MSGPAQSQGRGQRGGRGARGGQEEERGGRGRGGRGGRGRGDRPQTAKVDADGNQVRLDKDGRPITGASRMDGKDGQFRGRGRDRGDGRWRGESGAAHGGYDRRSGTGRGRRPQEKKDGAGKFNTGEKVEYKKKDDGTETAPAEEAKAPAEESKEEAKEEVKEEKKPEEPEYVEEVIG